MLSVVANAVAAINNTASAETTANDAQRDEHATKMNTVAAIDATVSFYSLIHNRYSWISIHGSLT